MQFGAAVGERAFAVLVEEEQAVLEPGAQHPLVAAGGQAQVVDAGVVHRHEPRQQAAVRAGHREVLLVLAHRGDQGFLGQLQEFFVEAAADAERLLHQVGDRVEQPLVQHRPGLGHPGVFAHRPPYRLDHAVAPLGRVDDDETGGQAVPVGGEAVHGEGLRRQEPMAAGGVGADDVLDGQRDGRAGVHAEQPLDRPGKGQAAVGPAHGLGEHQFAHEGLEHLRQQGRGLLALHVLDGHQVFAPGGLDHLQLLRGKPAGAGETDGRPGEVAVRVEAGLFRGADVLLAAVGLARLEIVDDQGQPAGRAAGVDPGERQTQVLEFPRRIGGQGVEGWLDVPGRDFFCADFKEKLMHRSPFLFEVFGKQGAARVVRRGPREAAGISEWQRFRPVRAIRWRQTLHTRWLCFSQQLCTGRRRRWRRAPNRPAGTRIPPARPGPGARPRPRR